MIGDSIDETNFSRKLLLPDREVSKLRKAFQTMYQLIYNYQKLSCLK